SMLASVNTAMPHISTGRRPYLSDKGPSISCPAPMPKNKAVKDIGAKAVLPPNFAATYGRAGTKMCMDMEATNVMIDSIHNGGFLSAIVLRRRRANEALVCIETLKGSLSAPKVKVRRLGN